MKIAAEIPGWKRTRDSLVEQLASLEIEGRGRLRAAETMRKCITELDELIACFSVYTR